jgi:HSP20 family protein
MSLLVKRRSGNYLPSLVNDFFDTRRWFEPSIFNLETETTDLEDSLVVPEVNVLEHDKDYKIEVAVPGLERRDIKVEMENGCLTISAEKKMEDKDASRNYRRREFSYNFFSRSFNLPENVMSDKIDARYENGVLNVVLPKKEATVTKPKKEIKIS